MSTVIPEGFGHAALVFSCAGVPDPIVTTFGYEWTADFASPDSSALAIRVACAGTGKWLHPSFYHNSYTFVRVDCIENDANGLSYGTSAQGDAGTIAGNLSAPPNCAILVRKNTALGGRKHRGRMFLPPAFVAEADVTPAGVLSGSGFTGLQTRLETFRTDLVTALRPMRLLHSDALVAPTNVTSLAVQQLLATQRRRLR